MVARDKATETEYSHFACSCDDFTKDADGKTVRTKSKGHKACDAMLRWAYKYLSHEHKKVTAANFLTSLVYHLEGFYQASIDDIATDMWAGISVSTYPRCREQFSAYVECDQLEHGLAYILRGFVDRFGEKNAGGYLNDEEWKAKQDAKKDVQAPSAAPLSDVPA